MFYAFKLYVFNQIMVMVKVAYFEDKWYVKSLLLLLFQQNYSIKI